MPILQMRKVRLNNELKTPTQAGLTQSPTLNHYVSVSPLGIISIHNSMYKVVSFSLNVHVSNLKRDLSPPHHAHIPGATLRSLSGTQTKIGNQ